MTVQGLRRTMRGMRRKEPTTDTPCLNRARGRNLRVALVVPAVGCQRVVGKKHGGASGRSGFRCGIGCGFCGDVDSPVDVIEADGEPTTGSELDHPAGDSRRNRLAALVVTDVSLCAADTYGKGGLGKAEAIPDGLDSVHKRDTSAARMPCQYRRYFVKAAPLLRIQK